ncbi:subtilase family protein [Prosthecobacter fusiformis]|uniref:Subtilase family protein n=1 Tax=Prosthecobacter fusiformis TaxID=48464 RepID=A0A4R7RK16_9BACT|nr:S8 family serine peptidase [Prosthecobacter fusiformis]TDU63165.1 subtilase family protein [Prosthecobacter fusiformis]
MPPSQTRPQNYFLNESHELSVGEKTGGGKYVEYPGINWTQKSKRLHDSLEKVSRRAAQSSDPLSQRRYYLIADPASEIVKSSTAKDAVEGKRTETVHFSGEQSKLFERIGLDLIEVHPSGMATVHASPERMEQLIARTQQLEYLGARQQARFVAFDSFEWLAGKLKFDQEWLTELGKKSGEGYIKLQPLITELEADLIFRALEDAFRGNTGLRLSGKGRSYMGRYFLRATLDATMIKRLADEFTSIQSIHPPIFALTESLPLEVIGSSGSVANHPTGPASRLPCVAVVDTAIPQEHEWLKDYRRGNALLGQNCSNNATDHHGSVVATRVVYGDIDLSDPNADLPPASCRFLEVRVGSGLPNRIRTESVATALTTALIAAPDVRVFNLSFDSQQRLEDMPATLRKETLKLIEDIDNLAFDHDVVVVVAAGNAQGGVIPTPPYPLHFDNPGWELHSYPRAFNALTCGGIARKMSAGGLVPEPDSPSPFSRVGPGFANSPKPDFCESAGDSGQDYRAIAGGGIWGLDSTCFTKETFGTSYAAPLLAREAAFVLDDLQAKCPGDSRPFACTAKAVLAMSADEVTARLSEPLQPLAKRTTGFGIARAAYFKNPAAQKARFVWQGVIEHEDDIVRVQIPIPLAWIAESASPQLKLCIAWDTPVNAAAESQWSCRDVEVKVLPGPEAKALHGSRGQIHGYPLFQRRWNLGKAREKGLLEDDLWTIELVYSQQAAYAAGHLISPSQRVAFVAEIWDEADEPLHPHSFVQGLPIASTFVRLSNTSAWLPQPVSITSDF